MIRNTVVLLPLLSLLVILSSYSTQIYAFTYPHSNRFVMGRGRAKEVASSYKNEGNKIVMKYNDHGFTWCCYSAITSGGNVSDEVEDVHPYTLKQRNPYDVHVYYDNNDPSSKDEAMELREKMMSQFDFMRFYTPKGFPIGPHPIPMWEADFSSYDNRHRWTEVRDFLIAEHGNLSILMHPHSTDGDYADHTKNAWWAGDVLDLRIQGWKR